MSSSHVGRVCICCLCHGDRGGESYWELGICAHAHCTCGLFHMLCHAIHSVLSVHIMSVIHSILSMRALIALVKGKDGLVLFDPMTHTTDGQVEQPNHILYPFYVIPTTVTQKLGTLG